MSDETNAIEGKSERLSKTMLIAIWAFVGVFVLGCVLFMVWHSHVKQAQRQATAIFYDAKRQIDGKQVREAIALLRKYIADPHATEKANAQRLLAEAETAVSDMLTLDALVAMNDEAFALAKAAGTIEDGKVTHHVLVAVRAETVQRNLDEAVERRPETKVAAERRRTAQRLATMERQRQEEELRRANKAFDLKGDRLGMSLAEFKAKYERKVEGHNKNAPFCSDTLPGEEIVTLLAEPWHTDAGIVNCSTVFPFETYGGGAPTIAHIETKLLVHHFVDGKLYMITAWLPHDGYLKVKEELIAKHGTPKQQQTNAYQNRLGATFAGELLVWANAVSTITLIERFGELDRSALIFDHRELTAIVATRTPKPTGDDL